MPLPQNAQDIYDLFLADPIIGAALGTYTLNDGTISPSLSVLFSNEKLPPSTIAEGLEITITALPSYSPDPLLTGEIITNPTWRIYITAWQNPSQLQSIIERILALLPGALTSTITGDKPGSGIGILDQMVISYTNPTASITSA